MVSDILMIEVTGLSPHSQIYAINAFKMGLYPQYFDGYAPAYPDSKIPSDSLYLQFPAHKNQYELRGAFWRWYAKYGANALVFADRCLPSVANLFSQLHYDDPTRTGFPEPIHQLSTLLLAAGANIDVDRRLFCNVTGVNWQEGNPRHDAIIGARCVERAFEILSDSSVLYQPGERVGLVGSPITGEILNTKNLRYIRTYTGQVILAQTDEILPIWSANHDS